MDSSDATGVSPRDYSTGLVAFGLLELVIGVLLFAKTVVFALLSIPGVMPAASPFGAEIPLTAAVTLAPAAFFLALGFGSIAARRWARSLAFALSLLWLAASVLALVFLVAWLPRILAAVRPVIVATGRAGGASAVRACLIVAIVGFALPAASALFYGSAGVKRECERRDAQSRWTDRLSVAALVLILALAVAAMLALQIGFSPTRQRLYFGRPLGLLSCGAWALLAAAEIAAAAGLAGMRRWAGSAAIAVMLVRTGAVIGITRRVAASPDAIFGAARGRTAPETQAMIEALRPLHLMRGVAAFIEVLSVAALVLAIGVGFSFRPRTAAEPSPE